MNSCTMNNVFKRRLDAKNLSFELTTGGQVLHQMCGLIFTERPVINMLAGAAKAGLTKRGSRVVPGTRVDPALRASW